MNLDPKSQGTRKHWLAKEVTEPVVVVLEQRLVDMFLESSHISKERDEMMKIVACKRSNMQHIRHRWDLVVSLQ